MLSFIGTFRVEGEPGKLELSKSRDRLPLLISLPLSFSLLFCLLLSLCFSFLRFVFVSRYVFVLVYRAVAGPPSGGDRGTLRCPD